MKVLTLHQPWASLIALGVKSIETRSWSTKYRGPLAIHAGATVPTIGLTGRVGCWFPLRKARVTRYIMQSIPNNPDDVPTRHALPLGAIVASCTLSDVVPMQSLATHRHDGPHLLVEPGYELALWTPEARTITEDQRPYGDFAPGRFAWLLDDVKPTTERCPACWGIGVRDRRPDENTDRVFPACDTCGGQGHGDFSGCDPIPAKGRQGLWEWDPLTAAGAAAE